jgi:peptide/nickel transport system permease protein
MTVRKDFVAAAAIPAERAPARRRGLRSNAAIWIGGVILLVMAIAGLSAGWIFPGDPGAMAGPSLLWPGQDAAFPLGTNSVGNNLLVELFYGARTSLMIGFAAAALSVVFGVGIGALAGFCGGWIDAVIMRIIAIFQTIPHFVLLVVVVAIVTPSSATVTLCIALVSWDNIARLARAEFRSLRNREYVIAARGSGYGPLRIALRQILPNALPPLIVSAAMLIGSAILMEAAVSFMGLGDPRSISWGSMIGEGRQFLRSAWYISAIPGAACVLTVLALNLLADGLNEALNPRLSDRPDD